MNLYNFSPTQKGKYLTQKSYPNSSLYSISGYAHFVKEIDMILLKKAIFEVLSYFNNSITIQGSNTPLSAR